MFRVAPERLPEKSSAAKLVRSQVGKCTLLLQTFLLTFSTLKQDVLRHDAISRIGQG